MALNEVHHTVYLVAIVLGVAGLALLVAGVRMRGKNQVGSEAVRFGALAFCALSVILGLSTWFVSNNVSKPIHIPHQGNLKEQPH